MKTVLNISDDVIQLHNNSFSFRDLLKIRSFLWFLSLKFRGQRKLVSYDSNVLKELVIKLYRYYSKSTDSWKLPVKIKTGHIIAIIVIFTIVVFLINVFLLVVSITYHIPFFKLHLITYFLILMIPLLICLLIWFLQIRTRELDINDNNRIVYISRKRKKRITSDSILVTYSEYYGIRMIFDGLVTIPCSMFYNDGDFFRFLVTLVRRWNLELKDSDDPQTIMYFDKP